VQYLPLLIHNGDVSASKTGRVSAIATEVFLGFLIFVTFTVFNHHYLIRSFATYEVDIAS
jgi:hypothetical protein